MAKVDGSLMLGEAGVPTWSDTKQRSSWHQHVKCNNKTSIEYREMTGEIDS